MKSSFAAVLLTMLLLFAANTPLALGQDGSTPGMRSSLRDRPLPYLQPLRSMLTDEGGLLPPALPEQPARRLTPAAAAAVSRLIDGLPPTTAPVRNMVILQSEQPPAETARADTGNESDAESHPLDAELRIVVQGPFAAARWNEARSELRALLSGPLPRRIEARARFYLGQSFYFSGLYRHATLEFLLAQQFYFTESTPWVHAALAALARES